MMSFILLAAALSWTSPVHGAFLKRAYPDSCPPDPKLPDLPSLDPITTATSALFAWQLVSLTAMGTPFNTAPCPATEENKYEMTCVVSDLLDKKNTATYHEKFTALGIETRIVVAIAKERVGCAANHDAFIVRERVRTYFDALLAAVGTSSPGPALPPRVERTTAMAKQESALFAWQLGAVLRDERFYDGMCGVQTEEYLRSGLELVAMDAEAFVGVFCGMFGREGLPSVEMAAQQQVVIVREMVSSA